MIFNFSFFNNAAHNRQNIRTLSFIFKNFYSFSGFI
jgi:hypothetical protein